MSSRHNAYYNRCGRKNCERPCCDPCPPIPDPCETFVGRRGERGDKGQGYLHSAYHSTGVYPINIRLEEPANILLNQPDTMPINLVPTFGVPLTQTFVLAPGKHQLKYNANLSWVPEQMAPIVFNSYFLTILIVGNQRVRVFRDSVSDSTSVEEENQAGLLPSVSFDMCVCTAQPQNVSIYTFMILPGSLEPEELPRFQVDEGNAILSIDTVPKDIDDTLVNVNTDPHQGLPGPTGYTGDAHNTSDFITPLLPNEFDSFGIEYSVDNPTLNPIPLVYRSGKCVSLKTEDNIDKMHINQTGYYRFEFSGTLNVDFPESPEVPVDSTIMQINLFMTINDNTPIIVKQLRTTVDGLRGAHKILKGFYEGRFSQNDKVVFYIQYFLNSDPGTPPNVLLGLLSSRTPSVLTNTKYIKTVSRGAMVVEKIEEII